jgi:glycosyltransferase involved in cell wall biosynthesis
MPVYRCAATIERALASIRSQAYPALEVILIDGGSGDGTLERAQASGVRFAALVSEPDGGQSAALNKGFRLARGEIFCWLNGDDALQPGALHHVAARFRAQPEASLLVGRCRRIYADGSEEVLPLAPDLLETLGYRNGIEQPSAFWRAALHRAAGELDESLHYALDWDWWNRLKVAGARLMTSERELSSYHFSAHNKTASNPEANRREMREILRRWGPFDGALAEAYDLLYRRFDLKGCYDQPPSAPPELVKEWWAVLEELYSRFGRQPIDMYNWTWCARQERAKQDASSL